MTEKFEVQVQELTVLAQSVADKVNALLQAELQGKLPLDEPIVVFAAVTVCATYGKLLGGQSLENWLKLCEAAYQHAEGSIEVRRVGRD